MTAFLAVKFPSALTFICASLLASGWAQNGLDNSEPSNGISACGNNQFTCRNGDCILRELLCDGRADCKDQSDETQIECTKQELTCPDYAFRCTYGACVSVDSVCNGVRDCLDNSDETLPRCPGISNRDSDDGCNTEDFRCKNSQCIDSVLLCDGTIDCADGSDETFVNCGSYPCSQSVFRCNYGACISNDLKCDNVSHCADGSDEDPSLCGRPGPGPSTVKPLTLPPRPAPRPTPGPVLSTKPSALLCQAPEQPPNGQWRVHKSLCGGISNGETDCEYAPGIDLEPGTALVYSCDPGYTIRGSSTVICGRDGRWWKIPVCSKITCSPLDSPSTSATCSSRLSGWVKCGSEVLPWTKARITCNPGYRKDSHSTPTQGDVLDCNDAGKWVPEPIRCIPVCGRASSRTTPLSVNGVIAKITDFPWHATLYLEMPLQAGPKKVFQCGATIIQADIVMTAAHCVYDERTTSTIDPRKLFVATGNTFRDYDYNFHDNLIVKKSAVKNVYRHCQYYGLPGKYASDIALLELQNPFHLSELLLPACLDITGERNQFLEPESYGKVAGFGRTADAESSAILQTVTLPYVPFNQCRAAANSSDEVTLIGTDKFCAGWTNGSAVCEGDSGGGLVFQEPGGLWYVMGIVSTSLGVHVDNGVLKCNHFTYSLYTRVSSHMGWMQDILIRLKQNQTIQSCK